MKQNKEKKIDVDYSNDIVPKEVRKRLLDMFMIMLGFTFFSGSMWAGQKVAEGLELVGFVESLIIGGCILSTYTGLLGYIGAKTGMSFDILARKALRIKGSYIPSAMISFTQIGWFEVGIAMFAIPISNYYLGGSKLGEWLLIIVAGACMTASAYFGITSLTLVSYLAVPAVAIFGTYATIQAVMQGDTSFVDRFTSNSGTISVISGVNLVVGFFISGGTTTPNFARFSKTDKAGAITTAVAFFNWKFFDDYYGWCCVCMCWWK